MKPKQIVYLSGPITGLPDDNRPMFKTMQQRVEAMGHEVINPHQLFEGVDTSNYTHDDYMRVCIAAMMRADMIITLPDWENSDGALKEVSIARTLGFIPVIHFTNFLKPATHAN